MTDLHAPLRFISGKTIKNRFILAPLTNMQSHEDGTLSDDEYSWLTMRAKGGFGATMTCASHGPAGLFLRQAHRRSDKAGRGHSRLRQPRPVATTPRGHAFSGRPDRSGTGLPVG